MIILDTDHISVLQHAESEAAQRLSRRLAEALEQISTTAATVEEQCRSWLALINRYSDVRRQVTYYARFVDTIRFSARWRILPFGEQAAEEFQRLRREGVRIASTDLKIAAITLVHNGTLISRNLRDFEKVPDLRVQDWLKT